MHILVSLHESCEKSCYLKGVMLSRCGDYETLLLFNMVNFF